MNINFLKHDTIKNKLITIVALMIGSVIILSTLSLTLMNKINHSNKRISSNFMPLIIVASDLNKSVSSFKIYENKHILANDKEKKNELKNSMDKIETEINNLFIQYYDLTQNETDKKLIETAGSDWNTYITLNKQIIELSGQGKTDEAIKILQGDGQKLFDEISSILLDIINLNKEGANQAINDDETIYLIGLILMTSITILITIASLYIAKRMIGSILTPIDEIKNVAINLSNGDLDQEILYNKKDEIGDIAEAFRNTIYELKNYISDIDKVLNKIANRNLNVNIDREYKGNFVNIKNSLNKIVDAYNLIFKEIDDSIHQVEIGSEQIFKTSEIISSGATEQASSVEELTASMEEIYEQAKNTSKNANNANQIVDKLVISIENSNTQMKSLIESMNNIEASSKNIKDIINTIDSIAEQTNLLALNAAIEAARAGEAGKGFSVVAEEVRKLAEQSSNAVKNTSELIMTSIKAVDEGNSSLNSTSESLKDVILYAGNTTKLVTEINHLADGVTKSVHEVNEGIQQISNVVQSNSAIAEESAASSNELNEQVKIVNEMIHSFHLK